MHYIPASSSLGQTKAQLAVHHSQVEHWFIVCINDGSSFSNSLNNEPIFQREKLDRENRMEAMENKKQAQCKNSIYDKLFGKCVRLSEHSAHFDRLKELCAYMSEVGHLQPLKFLALVSALMSCTLIHFCL